MTYLYIDTSSPFLYAGIVKEDKLISQRKKELKEKLSKEALYEISEMFKEAKISPDDVDKIIVVNGPGSFTGIRIGITIAKVYAWAKNIDITTTTSLLAMSLSSNNKKIHIPILDARRDFLYAAIYDENYKEILKPQHIGKEKLINKIKELSNYEIISNDNLEEFKNIKEYNPNILKIVNYLKNNKVINPHNVNPEYLKLSSVEEKKND